MRFRIEHKVGRNEMPGMLMMPRQWEVVQMCEGGVTSYDLDGMEMVMDVNPNPESSGKGAKMLLAD